MDVPQLIKYCGRDPGKQEMEADLVCDKRNNRLSVVVVGRQRQNEKASYR